jgi:hypothetical protein
MNRTLVVFCMFMALVSSGQSAQRPRSKTRAVPSLNLWPVASVIEIQAFSRNNWSLAFAYGKKEYQPKTGEDAATDLDKYINERPGTDWGAKLVAEHTLISKHRSTLESLVKLSLNPLLYTSVPVRLASHDGSLTLLLTSIGSKNIYNILRLKAKERAGEEIQKTVLPEIKQFQVVNSPTIKYFGVLAVYGTKDFSEPDSTPEPELVALIASAVNCRKLANAEITEEDFVATSDVYLVDRDEADDQVRKIKVSLGED